MNQNDYFEYEIYQWDKFCFKLKILFIVIMLLIIVILFSFLIITEFKKCNIWNISFVCLLSLFLSYFLFEDIKYLRIIENQKYRKLILDNHNNLIKLIDKSDNIIPLEFSNINKVQIEKYELIFAMLNIVRLGNIEFFISGEKHSIIISDIDNFIQNSIFQNVVSKKNL